MKTVCLFVCKIKPQQFQASNSTFASGGGGGVLPYVCILGMQKARETPIFSPEFHVPEHIIFTNYQKIRSGASPFYMFWRIFLFRTTIIFKISLISTRSSPPTAGSARTQSVSAAPRVIAAVPEHSHFHAQNGSSSFRPAFSRSKQAQARTYRSPAFSRSKRLKLVPEPHIFTAQNGSSSFQSRTFSRSTGSSFLSPCPFFTLPWHIPTNNTGVSIYPRG